MLKSKGTILKANKFIEKMRTKRKIRFVAHKVILYCVIVTIMLGLSMNSLQSYGEPVERIVQNKPVTANIVKKATVNVMKAQPIIKKVVEQKDVSIYNSIIPMQREHQEYLYKLCKERNLNYRKMLAIIKHESQFDVNCISDRDYGYFQINKSNHVYLSETLNTDNDPLDPYVSINWGTYMMSDIYKHWSNKGYVGKELDEMVWSEYNKGATGVRKYGLAYNYIAKVEKEKEFINSVF